MTKREGYKMKKIFLTAALILSGLSVFAAEEIAVVDLNQIVGKSSQVQQLKKEQEKKLAELDKILINARGEISNESDPAKVLILEDKYM